MYIPLSGQTRHAGFFVPRVVKSFEPYSLLMGPSYHSSEIRSQADRRAGAGGSSLIRFHIPEWNDRQHDQDRHIFLLPPGFLR
jgi:hypothetical protein